MFPYILLLNWIALLTHLTISGIYIWKIIEVNLAVDVYQIYPAAYNATNNGSYLGPAVESYLVGSFHVYIASLIFELVCCIAHAYMLFYMAYSRCCCSNACRESCDLSSLFIVIRAEHSIYYENIAQNFNRYRWVEYSISSTPMLLINMVIWANNIVILLLNGAVCNVLMIALGDFLQGFIRAYDQAQTRLADLDERYRILQGEESEIPDKVFSSSSRSSGMRSNSDSSCEEAAEILQSCNKWIIEDIDETRKDLDFQYCNIIKTMAFSWIVGILPWVNLFVVIPYLTEAPIIAKVMFGGIVAQFFCFGVLEVYHVYKLFTEKGLTEETQLWVEFMYIFLSLTAKVFLGTLALFLPVPNP